MKKILRRLRSRAGESLIESMAAILIFTMGSIIMLSMVSTAADINQTAKDADKSYYKQIVAAEMARTADEVSGTVTVSVNGSAKKDSVSVKVFHDRTETDALYTYYTAGTVVGAGGSTS